MKKHWLLTQCLCWLLAIALGNGVLAQDKQELTQPKAPLEQLLNRDGTLDLNKGFRGNLGWHMMTVQMAGEQHFVPAGVELQTTGGSQLMAVPGDIEWIRQFRGSQILEQFYEYIDKVSGAAYAGQVYVIGQTFFVSPPNDGTVSATGGIVRLYDTGGNEAWTIHISGAPYGVAADASGVYVGGMAWDPISGCPLGFLSKYDTNGNEAWTRQFDSPPIASNTWEWILGIAIDGSGVYVAGNAEGVLPGQTSAGAFVRKYDNNGSEMWTHQFGGWLSATANGVAIDASGLYVVGTTSGALSGQTSAGSYDAFVRKYDASGNDVWTRQFGSASDDYAQGIVVNASGVYAVGYTYGALPGQTSAGEYDAFVCKYDASGNQVWTRQFGSASYDYARGIAVDVTGVYVAGVTRGAFPGQTNAGSSDVFVRKYDAASNEVWTRQFGTSSVDESHGVAADASGVYVFGRTSGAFPGQTSSGGSDAFVAKIQISLPPAVDASGPYSVNEGGSVTVTASGNDPENGPLTYAWDLDNDGSFETPGQSASFSAAAFDGPSSQTIKVQVTDNGGLTATAQVTVNVLNVAPTANFTATPSTIIVGQSTTLAFSNQFDPSAADVAHGFLYSYDCTNDGTFEISDIAATTSYTCSYPTNGTFTAKGRIKGKDGDFTDYTVDIVVQTSREATGSLIEQIQTLVNAGTLNEGQGNGLIAKLEAAIQQLDKGNTNVAINQLRSFVNQVYDFMSATPPLLTQTEGQALIDAANAIIATLSNPTPASAAGLKKDGTAAGELPTGFQLEQNSPNPFNPVTTIQFSVPRESYVQLKIYNSFGAEVATLVDQQVAAGTYKINWNASHLASGFYLYRLEAEGFAQTKKLLLMK